MKTLTTQHFIFHLLGSVSLPSNWGGGGDSFTPLCLPSIRACHREDDVLYLLTTGWKGRKQALYMNKEVVFLLIFNYLTSSFWLSLSKTVPFTNLAMPTKVSFQPLYCLNK